MWSHSKEPQIWTDGIIQTSPMLEVALRKIKGPIHEVEDGHHLWKGPTLTHPSWIQLIQIDLVALPLLTLYVLNFSEWT